MNYSKQLTSFAHDLVSHYAKFDNLSDGYHLLVSDLNDFDLHEFASLFMANDPAYASEATGPDNPHYEKIMLPALIRYMKNTTDKDEEIEFNKAWREGIANYFANAMQELIDQECCNKLFSEAEEAGRYPKYRRDNGELYWSSHP